MKMKMKKKTAKGMEKMKIIKKIPLIFVFIP